MKNANHGLIEKLVSASVPRYVREWLDALQGYLRTDFLLGTLISRVCIKTNLIHNRVRRFALTPCNSRGTTPNSMAIGVNKYRPKVLVPLYYYPLTSETWQPLHQSIVKHPDVTFVVVVNPNSGPDKYPLPSHDYVRELPKLNRHANVITVGYVKIDYCKQPIGRAISEINIYAGWGGRPDLPDLDVAGIYIDETPNHFTPERAEYLETLRRHIKRHSGFIGDKLVIHNPGTPPDAGLAHPENGPDVICTCEEPFDLYRCDRVQQRLKEYHFDRTRSAYQISAVPIEQMQPIISELCQRGEYVFATDLVDDFYESFSTRWNTFVDAVANSQSSSQEAPRPQPQPQPPAQPQIRPQPQRRWFVEKLKRLQ